MIEILGRGETHFKNGISDLTKNSIKKIANILIYNDKNYEMMPIDLLCFLQLMDFQSSKKSL
jgi:hypothetical protein